MVQIDLNLWKNGKLELNIVQFILNIISMMLLVFLWWFFNHYRALTFRNFHNELISIGISMIEDILFVFFIIIDRYFSWLIFSSHFFNFAISKTLFLFFRYSGSTSSLVRHFFNLLNLLNFSILFILF